MRTTCIILLCAMILYTCGKPEGSYVLPQELKDYAMYEEGSYWVYVDTANNLTDSVMLESSVIETVGPSPSNGNFEYENLEQRFYSSYAEQYGSRCAVESTSPLVYSYVSKQGLYKTGQVESDNLCNGEPPNIIVFCNYYDSLTIGNNTYYNVKCFRQDEWFFSWAKGIGVFYKEIPADFHSNGGLIYHFILFNYSINQ